MRLVLVIGSGPSSGSFNVVVAVRPEASDRNPVPRKPPILVDIGTMVVLGQINYCDGREYQDTPHADKVLPVLKWLFRCARPLQEINHFEVANLPIEWSSNEGATLKITCDLNPLLT